MNPNIMVPALPWSPPAWMKTNGDLNGGTLNTANFPALATYFTTFIQAYEANGIPIHYLAVQNEPLNVNSGYPTMFMNSGDEGQFISQYLGPALHGLKPKNQQWNFTGQNEDPSDATPGILGYEHNWDNPNVQLTIGKKETPFGGAAAAVPGLVQAEDFDLGGKSLAYWNVRAAMGAGRITGLGRPCISKRVQIPAAAMTWVTRAQATG